MTIRGKLTEYTWIHDPADDYVPPRYRRSCRYKTFSPLKIMDWAPDVDGDLAGVIADAERAVAKVDHHPAAYLYPMSRLLARSEAIASSKIEGMQVGVRELARAEVRYRSGAKVGRESREIITGIDSLRRAVLAVSARSDAITMHDLLDTHARLMSGAASWTRPGAFRSEQNWIGGNDFNPCGADFVPPAPELVDELMVDLLAACNDDRLPAVLQAAIVHAQFETIHPFNDGNGRLGRALIQMILRKRGLTTSFVPPISVVLSQTREQYIQGLTDFRFGNPRSWFYFFATTVARSAVLSARYVERVNQLQEDWRSALENHPERPQRSDAAAWRLIDELPAHPILDGSAAIDAIERSKPTTNQAISQLVAAGVLIPVSTGKRNRLWEPAGLIELIEKFGGQ